MARGTDYVERYQVWQDKANNSIRYFWFDTVYEIIDCINAATNGNRWSNMPWEPEASEWAGSKDMPQALEYLRYGWPEVADAIFLQDAALAMNRPIESEFEVMRDVVGGAVDIGVYVTGQPEDMVNFMIRPRPKKTIKILFNVCSSGCTAKKYIIERGHTVTSICDFLERSGFRVRIDVADTAYGRSNTTGKQSHWTLAFCAKDFNQPLDFGRIGFMLGSPSMLRRIFFGVEAGSKLWNSEFWSFGSVAPVHHRVGNNYDYVFDYNTPVNMVTAKQLVDYVISGKAIQKDITGYYEDDNDFTSEEEA